MAESLQSVYTFLRDLEGYDRYMCADVDRYESARGQFEYGELMDDHIGFVVDFARHSSPS